MATALQDLIARQQDREDMMPIQPIPPRRGVKRPAPIAEPLPIKSQRESKRIYVTEHGNFVAYSERLNAMKICQDCAANGTILSANYKDTNGQQKLCKKCASALGTHSKALGHHVPSRCSEEIVDAAIVSARLITLHPNAEPSSIT